MMAAFGFKCPYESISSKATSNRIRRIPPGKHVVPCAGGFGKKVGQLLEGVVVFGRPQLALSQIVKCHPTKSTIRSTRSHSREFSSAGSLMIRAQSIAP